MSLLALQREFHAHVIADDEAVLPSALRYDVYRNNYRTQLVDCLASVYEKTRLWVGEDSFEAAACHHVLTRPPTSWTIDDYGSDFCLTLEQLFPKDPEVPELAWLEWAMQHAFAANDAVALDPAWLGSGILETVDWDGLCFGLAPGFQSRKMNSDVVALWSALKNEVAHPDVVMCDAPATLIVWRKAHSPHFRLLDAAEVQVIDQIAAGQSFAAICEVLSDQQGADQAIPALGAMLVRWINDGLLTLPDSN